MTQEDKKKETTKVHWSLKTSFRIVSAILLVTSIFVLGLMHTAVWVELETLAAIVGVLMTLFYTYILYYGVVFIDDHTVAVGKFVRNPVDVGASSNFGDFYIGIFTEAGASEGPIGLLIGLLLDLIVSVLLAFVLSFLLWLGVNLVVESAALISLPLIYIFKRSLKFVLRHTEECRGDLASSLKFGFAYAAFKTATLCLIIFFSHTLAQEMVSSLTEETVKAAVVAPRFGT